MSGVGSPVPAPLVSSSKVISAGIQVMPTPPTSRPGPSPEPGPAVGADVGPAAGLAVGDGRAGLTSTVSEVDGHGVLLSAGRTSSR